MSSTAPTLQTVHVSIPLDSGQTSNANLKGKDTQRCYPRRYYVLTDAGKPVWTSQSADPKLMGVAQALISMFAQDDDRPKSIVKGNVRIAFLLKPPLYLFAVSDWGEPEHVLRLHLGYIHLHIISVVTSTQLSRAFQRRSNFDPTRLLEGTEPLLTSLIDRCQYDFSLFTSSLQPLRMPPALREQAAACLVPPSRIQDLLYVVLIAGGHIVTLLRPRKHLVHPSDLHLVLNTAASLSGETFLPICLPKFNPAGFVHALIGDGLILVSAARDSFEDLQTWKRSIMTKLPLQAITRCVASHPYSAAEISPIARHFLFKDRKLVQITASTWPEGECVQEVTTRYQQLSDLARSSGLRLIFESTERMALLCWITEPFELYVSFAFGVSKAEAVGAANTIADWASRESHIFFRDAPVF